MTEYPVLMCYVYECLEWETQTSKVLAEELWYIGNIHKVLVVSTRLHWVGMENKCRYTGKKNVVYYS